MNTTLYTFQYKQLLKYLLFLQYILKTILQNKYVFKFYDYFI